MDVSMTAMLAGLLAGAAGALGLGGGSILMIYLTLIAGTGQLQAQGINLIFFIPCAITALLMHQSSGRVPWKLVVPTVCWGLPFALAGFAMSEKLGGNLMGKVFGGFLVILGVKEIITQAHAE